jgi:rfaE bifunctional protein kinase chain/domain/rfaE bifunctional protein nucleotidyltransferase chain/domain
MKDNVSKKGRALTDKILTVDQLAEKTASFRDQGLQVVQCHGVFDLVHPGHIRHLEAALDEGDVLVVTITADRFVNKGPGRPVFNARLRAETLAALECVTYVAVNDAPNAVKLISTIKPSIYAKGNDYANAEDDVTGMIAEEQRAVESGGGKIVFTNEMTMSSSELINSHFDVYSQEARDWLTDFRTRHSIDDVNGYLEQLQGLKVLIIGEAIIDEYHFCESLGKSAKDPILAFKYLNDETYIGGSLAIANHIAGFCSQVSLISLVGDDDDRTNFIQSHLRDEVDFYPVVRSGTPTIQKRRYVDVHGGGKLFELYKWDDSQLDSTLESRLIEAIETTAADCDLVIVSDYGHGMMTQSVIEKVKDKSKFLAVNTQANAGNRGFNTISRYSGADYICLNGSEVQLEIRTKELGFKEMVTEMQSSLGCDRFTVTLGRAGSLHFDETDGFVEAPALAIRVADRVGAGDAVLALTSPLMALGTPLEVVALLTNLAGAEMVQELGTSRSIDHVSLSKHVTSILK